MRLLKYLLLVTTLNLSACVYHQPFEQGNILSPEKSAQVKYGMSSQQVAALLGSPVLKNIYNDRRMIYVYANHPSRNVMHVQRLVITFKRNHVVRINNQ